MTYTESIGSRTYRFADLKTLLAKASPPRSGDQLAGLAAASEEERVAAKMALSEVPLRTFLNEALIPYESDEVTRLIIDDHSAQAFAEIAHLTVGDFRNWLLSSTTDTDALERVKQGLTPEMLAAVTPDSCCASFFRVVGLAKASIPLTTRMRLRSKPRSLLRI